MTTSITNIQTLQLNSGAQSMFQFGAADQLSFNEYTPIIGGAARDLSIANVVLTDGPGSVSVDGDRLAYDDEGVFDGLASDASRAVTIAYHIVDETGVAEERSVVLEARGPPFGTGFFNKTTGETCTDNPSFVAFDAKDMLQDVHHFGRVTPIDIELDLGELFEVDLEQAGEDIGEIGQLAAKAGEIGLLQLEAGAARYVLNAARFATNALNKLNAEAYAAEAAKFAKARAFDVAKAAVATAESAARAGRDALA